MDFRLCLFYLASAASLVGLSQAALWGPRDGGRRGRGEVLPVLMDIPDTSGEALSDVAAQAIHPASRLRQRRDVENDEVGYTTPLSGDHHTFALVHWTGYPSEALFILTRRRTRASGYTYSDESWLWRSLDYGHTFVNDTSKWDSDTVAEWYYISPFSEYLIFTDRIHHRLYVTRDEGANYTRYDINFRPDRLTYQSRYSVNSTDSPYREYVLGYDSLNHTLWVSVDLGSNWRMLSDNVVEGRYYWRSMPGIEGLGTVYFEKNVTNTESKLYVVRDVSDANTNAVIFDPNLGNFMKNTFVLEREYMFVQKVSSGDVTSTSSPLWVSHNRSMFQQADFPLHVEERHYAVVDASEGQVFIAVYHDINNTNLYLSEARGLNYSLSLQHILSPPESDWTDGGYPRFDVHVMEGIVGTYIANQRAPGSRYGTSVISYDKGGGWSYLLPPAVDSNGTPIICAPPDCSLHLHMESDRVFGYQSILSQDSAVGLLMALGNLGSSLSSSRSDVRLYFSRDGGFSWFEVDVGSWEFQFAALGSVVVTVKKGSRTNTIKWSCDEGRTWDITQFSNNTFGINVIGMLTEREEKARHVTIFGYNYSAREWLIVDLNFTSVVPTQCAEEDYFQWLPSDDRPGSRCLLGEVITYERRNSTFCCYINPLYDRPVSRTPCPCTVEDFECDFGFERISLNSPCTALSWLQWPPPPPNDCTENGNYNISSGYRKIAGDKCVPGNETYFFEQVRPCPALPPNGLFINYDIQFYFANDDITFQLTQLQGWKDKTVYTWDFNDTTVVNVTGFGSDPTLSQTHAYASPGNYTVSVRASNSAGAYQTIRPISVLDRVQGVSIVAPIQAVANNSAPTGILLFFRAQLHSQYSTVYVGWVSYNWTFGDGASNNTHAPFVSHRFLSPGTYNVLLRAIALYSTVEARYQLTIYDSAKHVQIVSDSLKPGRFVVATETVSFTVARAPGFSESIPPDTFYTWHVVPPSDTSLQPVTASGKVFQYAFPMNGIFDISVVGNHSAGSFSKQIVVTAEYNISYVQVKQASTLRAGAQTQASLFPKLEDGSVYSGFVSYHVITKSGDNLTDTVMSTTGGHLIVQFDPLTDTLTTSKDIPVTYVVWNDVSTVSKDQTIGVVVPGDYATIRLVFTVSTAQNNSAWMSQLKMKIRRVLISNYSLTDDQIEIESTLFVDKPQDAPVTPSPGQRQPQPGSRNILKKRSAPEQLLLVDVNILPVSIKAGDINTVKNVSDELIKKGSLNVTVNGQTFTAQAEARDSIIIKPGQPVLVTNWKLYSGIGGGLGAVLILGVASSIVLGLIIYYYRRRYNRLSVRYSRLSQAPVRFTFTQSGDMVEEDDPDIDAVDTTCGETDKDDQPLQQLKFSS